MTQVRKPNSGLLSELTNSVDLDNHYMDQSRKKKLKTMQTIPNQPREDEYDYTQGQWGDPGEGSSRPGDPRVQRSSQRSDPRSSHSIPQSMAQDHHGYPYNRNRKDSSRMENSKGDKYSRKPSKDMFNSYLSSSHHTDSLRSISYSTSQLRGKEDSGDASDSSSGSGSETASLRPHLGKAIRGRGSPSGLSKSKLQQTWVAEPSGSKERESARSSVQQSSSRRDTRARRTNKDYVAGGQGFSGSYPSEGGGEMSGHLNDSQNRSSYKERGNARPSVWQSSSRQDSRARRTDDDFVAGGQGLVGTYQGEGGGPSGLSKVTSQRPWGGGQLAASGDSQTRSGHKGKERDRSSTQQSSSRPVPRSRGGGQGLVGSHRGAVGGGISGHPNDSQTRSGYRERESARSSAQQRSSRQDPRITENDENYVADGQAMSGGSNGIPYTEQDHPASNTSTETISATEHSPRRSGPYPIPRRKEDSPPRNTRVWGRLVNTVAAAIITAFALRGWRTEGSSQPEDPSHTKPDSPSLPLTNTTQLPQHEASHSHPSQAQGSSGSQLPENIWGAESSRPSGRDSRSKPSVGATESDPSDGQPTAPPPGWSANSPHRVFFPPSLH